MAEIGSFREVLADKNYICRMKYLNSAWQFFAIFLCLFWISCKEDRQVDPSQVFKYNQPNIVTSLDPAFAKSQNNMWVMNHVYNTLVSLDDSLRVIPALANAWEVSEDGLIYTFYLKTEVYFHRDTCFDNPQKTRKLTADDVVFSFSRLIDDAVNSPGSWIFKEKVKGKESFVALNDSVFQLVLLKPFVPTMGMLTMQYCSVIPKEAAEFYGEDLRLHMVGTGPYKQKRWIENQNLFLERNEQYFDTNYFDTNAPKYIKTSFIPDKQIAVLELLKGNIDLVSGIESAFVNELLDADGKLRKDIADKIAYVRTPFLNTEYIGINQELAQNHPGLKHKKFRQALNWALDRKLMLESLRNGVGQSANAGFTPRGLPSFNADLTPGYSYDPNKAKALISELNLDLKNLPPIVINTNSEYMDLATFVARQWEVIGVKTSIELLDTGILREGMRNSKLLTFRASWIADYPDAESYFTVFYSKNPSPPNYTRFANEDFDRLYEASIQENDEATRYNQYHEMEKILIDEAPVIFLFYDESSVFTSIKLQGYKNNGLNMLNLNGINKSK